MSTTLDPVAFWARVRPDRTALRMGSEVWTYGRLEEAVSHAALALYDQGLVSGEHVSIEFGAEQGLHFAATLHALHRAELLPTLVAESLPEPQRIALRNRANVDFALTSTPEPAEAAARRGKGPRPPRFERRLTAPAAICFTSGTEGDARAVVLTHGNFLWSALASARNLGVRADDLWLACLPLHHVGGLSILTRSAYYGTAALIHDRFDADAVNHAIDAEGVTLTSLVPPQLERVLAARNDRLAPASLRAVLVGGGPAPAALLERAAALGMRALPTYGMTETTSQITTLSPRDWPRGLDTVGRPLPFARVEARGPDGRALPAGEPGDLYARGPMVTSGSFGGDEPPPRGDPRWLRTGDIGVFDAEGRLRILDRRLDRFVVGGENVSATEVERVIASHPSVREACVVGIPADAWGHEIAVAVVLREGARVTLEELRAHAGATLASYQLPRRLWIVASLPRSGTGKVLRGEVRRRLGDEVLEKDRA